jgi:hypothetical protein
MFMGMSYHSVTVGRCSLDATILFIMLQPRHSHISLLIIHIILYLPALFCTAIRLLLAARTLCIVVTVPPATATLAGNLLCRRQCL